MALEEQETYIPGPDPIGRAISPLKVLPTQRCDPMAFIKQVAYSSFYSQPPSGIRRGCIDNVKMGMEIQLADKAP